MFNKLKTSHKIILFFIIPTITFWASLYFLGPKILKEIWKHTDRYQNEVDCFVGRLTCFNSYLTEEQFKIELNRLDLSSQEAYNKAQKAKLKWQSECKNGEHSEDICQDAFKYFDLFFRYLYNINKNNKMYKGGQNVL